eukprot:m.21634 g.21634  ORF g.21634 m.21634 type:complete len:725 (+) comp8309_c0_seq4:73-2247(+)
MMLMPTKAPWSQTCRGPGLLVAVLLLAALCKAQMGAPPGPPPKELVQAHVKGFERSGLHQFKPPINEQEFFMYQSALKLFHNVNQIVNRSELVRAIFTNMTVMQCKGAIDDVTKLTLREGIRNNIPASIRCAQKEAAIRLLLRPVADTLLFSKSGDEGALVPSVSGQYFWEVLNTATRHGMIDMALIHDGWIQGLKSKIPSDLTQFARLLFRMTLRGCDLKSVSVVAATLSSVVENDPERYMALVDDQDVLLYTKWCKLDLSAHDASTFTAPTISHDSLKKEDRVPMQIWAEPCLAIPMLSWSYFNQSTPSVLFSYMYNIARGVSGPAHAPTCDANVEGECKGGGSGGNAAQAQSKAKYKQEDKPLESERKEETEKKPKKGKSKAKGKEQENKQEKTKKKAKGRPDGDQIPMCRDVFEHVDSKNKTLVAERLEAKLPLFFDNLPKKMEKVRKALSRDRLRTAHSELFGSVSQIPYGDIFGIAQGGVPFKEYFEFMDFMASSGQLESSSVCAQKHTVECVQTMCDNLLKPIRKTAPSSSPSSPTPSSSSAKTRPALRHFEEEPLYLFDSKILDAELEGSCLIPNAIRDVYAGEASHRVRQLYVGPPCTGSPMHFHYDAFNFLAHGTKLWFLSPPALSDYSKIHPVLDLYAGESLKLKPRADDPFPLACVQGEGELLYIPLSWGHGTINLSETFGCATELSLSDGALAADVPDDELPIPGLPTTNM